MSLQSLAPAADVEYGVFVLHNRPLREGATLDDTSRFSDDMWRLAPAQLQHQQSALALNFAALPLEHRGVCKALCYAMLSGPCPPGEPRLGINAVHRGHHELKTFFSWLTQHAPGRAIAELTGADLVEFQRHLLLTRPSVLARAKSRAAVRLLWRYRDATGGLPFDPRHVAGWTETRSARLSENATDRIPEPVLGPLIVWASRFVDEFAPDILAVSRRWCDLREQHRTLATRTADVEARLQRVLAGYRERDEPLPGRGGRPNGSFLALMVGCNHGSLDRYRAQIHAASLELGVATSSRFDVPITATLEAGQPWIPGIVSTPQHDHGLAALTRHLHIACYIVIAYLSGMRDSEIKHLRRGCLHVERASAGDAYRWKVTSIAFKGERNPTGTEATWIIGHSAARAIAVLERLQAPDAPLLFASLGQRPGGGPNSGSANIAVANSVTNTQLNAFIGWTNRYCAVHDRQDAIPQVNDQGWRLTTRQFRRTLAWFIARRPGGAIAGAIQYRHQAIQMFEGYAGTSDSGFRAEVESEQALARGEHLLAMIEQHEHSTLAGPAAREAATRLEVFHGQARFAGSVITDPRRLTRLMRRADPAIYPGTYATCVFDPGKALCHKHRDNPASQLPVLGDCRPLDCHNVALTINNIDNLRTEADRIQRELAQRPTLPPLLEQRLHDRHRQIIGFITPSAHRGEQ